MKKLLAALAVTAIVSCSPNHQPWEKGAFETGEYRNLFLEYGYSQKEIDKKLDDIISFSALEDFIDNPVRIYSSGMYMRLAFAVAINVEAEILFIDEILAVGDAAFQDKCFKKLMEIKEKGTTIVIVSHSLDQIEKFCDRSIWIKDGKIEMDGSPAEVHKEYLEFIKNR